MPVHPVFALEAACELLLEEGIEARVARHAAIAEDFRTAMRRSGVGLLCEGTGASPTLSALTGTDALPPAAIKHSLLEAFDISVAGTMDPSVPLVRVGHMAETARVGPMRQVVAAVEALLRDSGRP
jgi:aspartate aminotransferase-like enzyme